MKSRGAHRKTEIKRSDILDAATRCFAARGFDSATIREIAEEGGLLAGSLYYHFATKEEMLHEIMRPFLEDILRETRRIARGPGDPAQVLRALIGASCAHATTYRAQHQILISDRALFRDEGRHPYAREAWEAIRLEWQGIFRAGIAKQAFRPDLDPDVATQIVTRMINSSVGWFSPKGRLTMEELVEFISNLVLGGVTANPSSQERGS